MNFDLQKSISILNKTPEVLNTLLRELPDEWTSKNEGSNTWSPYDIVGHLIHGEKTDWIPRLGVILQNSENKTFNEFDREAQFKNSLGKNLKELLLEFQLLREENLDKLKSLNLSEKKLTLKGIHPEFGEITLKQLLATWTVHDLGHIAQISRVLAKQYKKEVGPWTAYLGILK